MLRRGAVMVYDCFQAYGPGIRIMIVSACECDTDAGRTIYAFIIINTGAKALSSFAPSLWNNPTFHYLSVQQPRLPPSEDVSKHSFSTWPSCSPPPPFPTRRHRCAQRPVDVTE